MRAILTAAVCVMLGAAVMLSVQDDGRCPRCGKPVQIQINTSSFDGGKWEHRHCDGCKYHKFTEMW